MRTLIINLAAIGAALVAGVTLAPEAATGLRVAAVEMAAAAATAAVAAAIIWRD